MTDRLVTAAKTTSFLRRFMKKKAALASLVITVLIMIFSVFGPMMNPYGYNGQSPEKAHMPPKIPALAQFGICDGKRLLINRQVDFLSDSAKYPEGSVIKVVKRYENNGVDMCDVLVDYYVYSGVAESYWFGTDYLGRDLWTRLWFGVRMSLLAAAVSVAVSAVVGTLLGALAGYYGGGADMAVMRAAEVIGAFPLSVVAVILVLFMGSGFPAVIAAISVRGWIGTARIVRGQFLRYREREFALAARSMGLRDRTVLFRHILPNAYGPILTRVAMEAPEAIFAEAFLAFIGIGAQAPSASIGTLLSDGQRVLAAYPYQVFIPAVFISILIIALNLISSGLRDVLDPRDAVR